MLKAWTISTPQITYLNPTPNPFACTITIEDDEFTVSVRCGDVEPGELKLISSIINEYSKRNLNVATNLAILFSHYNRQSSYIKALVKDLPKLATYIEDIEKLLLLI